MRIIKAKWHIHPILGNLELNFTKNGNPCSTIVLAGENGTGKTAILTSLFKFCNFETAEGLMEVEMETPRGIAVITAKNDSSDTHTEYIATFADGTTEDWKASRDSIVYKKFIGSNPNDPRNNGCSMSKAEAIYNVTEVKNISAKELDSQTIEKNKDNFSPQNLKELFVDIAYQDYTDYSKRGEQAPNNPNTYAAFDATSRISRFKKAFKRWIKRNLNIKAFEEVVGISATLFF